MQYFAKVVSTQPMLVSTPCFKTQSKNMKNWSSSVDTSSSSVDTRDRFQKTSWRTWDSVSTLDQVVADTTGKKNGLVWMISCSPATKNFSPRPQQVLKLVPRITGSIPCSSRLIFSLNYILQGLSKSSHSVLHSLPLVASHCS
ncbi:hypothetical protein Taro_012269 [Colocasia esculenta]|uniref:Uncharacterized protein n=1 Tax=Colocasia esculenta TaxID=4460 RepID=A0A843U8L5_COLES|nr:hypothetical protein [Colocasia esculenta]